MWHPEADPIEEAFYRVAEAAAQKFAVEVVAAPVRQSDEIERIMTMLGREPGGGLILPPNSFTTVHRKLIINLAARNRLSIPASISRCGQAQLGGHSRPLAHLPRSTMRVRCRACSG